MDPYIPSFDVLVIGCGPVGLFAAYLLGQRGVQTLIIDKHVTRRGQPKAHAINPRSLEIFRQTGLDVPCLRRAGLHPQDVDLVRFVSSFYGWEFGNLPYERQLDDVKDVTPEPLFNIDQPSLEEYLLSEALESPYVIIQKPVEWRAARSIANGDVISTLYDRQTDKSFEVQSRYIIACDGSRSTAREVLKFKLNPLPDVECKTTDYVTTHFKADLSGGRSGILFFIMQPDGLRTFIRYGAVDWVLVYRFNPEKVQPSTFTEEECSRHIQAALGKDVEFEILSITIWSTTPRIVESYRSSLVKNAFLAGDSAHTFSPTGGLGQNTGFGDVHNLVWKLLMVMNGHALDILMDSYDEERITVAVANARQSTVNEAKMDVLGQTINPASERGHGSQEWENEDFQYKVREAIQHNADHFDSLDLQLGMIYNKLPRPTDQNVSKFVQKAVPGARLPHAWVEFGGKVDASSLDLVGYSDLTLLCPDLVLAHELESRLSANVRELVQIKILGSHFTTNNTDWLDMLFTTQRNRAVLVRPDQHIASLLDSTSSMVQAFRSINLEVPNPPSFS